VGRFLYLCNTFRARFYIRAPILLGTGPVREAIIYYTLKLYLCQHLTTA
jgi:hypothetical protein